MVSVIIPNYNRATLIGYTLDSLLRQTYTDWECIVVDDGSSDNSEEIVKAYIAADNRFSFYKRPDHMPKGANSCRNFGFLKSKGEYVKWFDSDDLLIDNCLALQTELLDANPSAMVCFGYAQYFNNLTGELAEPWSRNMVSEDYLYDHVINKIRWPTGAILWRKNFLRDEPFYPTLKNSQEWLMHSIALIDLKQLECINLPQIVHLNRRGNLRMSSDTSSTYYFNQARSRYLLLSELFNKNIFSFKLYYQLVKQVCIYTFYAVKKLLTKKVNAKT